MVPAARLEVPAAALHDRHVGDAAVERVAAGRQLRHHARAPCPPPPSARVRLGRASGRSRPSRRARRRSCRRRSAAAPARRGEVRGERVGVDVQQRRRPRRRRRWRRPARSRARAGPSAADVGASAGTPTSPRSTTVPTVVAAARPARPGRSAHPRRSGRPPCTPAATERGDEGRVGASRQHGDDGVERVVVGDPQAVDEARRLAARPEVRVDRAAAAVDDDERTVRAERGDRPAAARIAVASSSSSPPSLRTVAMASIEARGLVEAERDVEVLHRLAGRPLHQVVDARRPSRAAPSGETRQPMSQKFVCATCLISGRSAPVSRTNGESS